MCNYLWGVKYHDQTRFKVVKDETSGDPTVSQTVNITGYLIKPLVGDKNYVIIDTPGFGDTDNRDDQFLKDIQKFFEETKLNMKAVCFCIKSSENRMTDFLKSLINDVMSSFDKNCMKNIIAMCTFASMNDPECLSVLEKEKIETHFKFDNQAIFPKGDTANVDPRMAETLFDMAYGQY